ncbi:FecR family protein [Methylophilus aquaticus]|uniref:FecR family protein n=1 Tax=Methylophilus aquaticus TaxID=1971610 RepID=A0ABT9JUQ5_9PROT|nr:FecR family protein [Methylophilus aquaticus]MDP8568333.1 FecR family protein [Methylophilus aquaticus]
MNQPQAISTAVDYVSLQQEALEWQVMLWSGEVTTEQQHAFEGWLSRSTLHQQVWSEMKTVQQKLQLVPQTSIVLARDKLPSAKRRRLLQMLGLAAVTGGAVPVLRQSEAWQTLAADYRTYTGQQEKIQLADGSQLMMNTSTAVDIAFSARERKLVLHEGEIYITTAPDVTQARPLLVQTRHGTATALGTQFNVRLKQHETRVSVYEGAAKLQSYNRLHSLTLASGMQAGLLPGALTTATSNGNESAWLDGKLVAEQLRLGDFLDELSRYRVGVIRYDQSVANMRVSGVFPLPDTDRVLQSLLQALPLRVDYFSRYWVTVHAA